MKIRELLNAGCLITKGGDIEKAQRGAYEMTAGTIYPPGHSDDGQKLPSLDWTGASPSEQTYRILPNALVVIQTMEHVHMPDNAGGLFLQVHNLSNKGLLLLNMTLIPPGYAGPLSCTFLNLGKEAVTLHARETIARVVFFTFDDGPNQVLSAPASEGSYRRWSLDAADTIPASLLDVDTLPERLRAEFSVERDAAVAKIEGAGETAAAKIEQSRDTVMASLLDSFSSQLWKAWKPAAAIVLAVGVAQVIAGGLGLVFDLWRPSAVEERAKALAGEVRVDLADVRAFERRLADIEKKLDEQARRGAGSQPLPAPAPTTPVPQPLPVPGR